MAGKKSKFRKLTPPPLLLRSGEYLFPCFCCFVIPRPTFTLTLFITQVEESIDQLVEEMSEKRELYENFMSNGRILQNVCNALPYPLSGYFQFMLIEDSIL